MNFSIKMIKITGKALAKEMKQSGYSSEDNLYDVENGMQELLGEIGKAGLAEFLEEEDDELH